MSPSSYFPWLSVNQVASLLKWTPANVRKRTKEGTFPRPIGFAGVQLYAAADVRAWMATRQAAVGGGGEFVTGQAALAIQADAQAAGPLAPVRLVIDVVREWKGLDVHPVHVRIYRGADRTVVLLSEPVGRGNHRILINHIERVVAMVAGEFFTDEQAEAAYWVDIWPPMEETYRLPGFGGELARITNPVLHHDRATQRWSDPEWPPLSVVDLKALLRGAQVDWFDWPHYTPQLIHRWQRDGQPVEVTHDANGYAKPLDALAAFDAADPSTCPLPAQDVAVARDALLGHLAELHDDEIAAEIQPAGINTSLRVPLRIPHEVLASLPTLEAVRARDYAHVAHAYSRLHEARYLVDQYAACPDPALDQALQVAIDAQHEVARLIDFERSRSLTWLPDGTVRTVDVGSSWDRRYLETITWQDGPDLDDDPVAVHHRNALAAGVAERHAPRFGHDPFGDLVCYYEAPGPREQTYPNLAIWWPTRYPGETPRPAEVHVVVDGTARGDRPAYLVRHGALIGLLPCAREYGGWSFGYGGSGPTDLTLDVAAFAAATRSPVDDWSLSQIVTDKRNHDLDIDLDALPAPRLE